jgi:hypothetical protein
MLQVCTRLRVASLPDQCHSVHLGCISRDLKKIELPAPRWQPQAAANYQVEVSQSQDETNYES